MHLQQLLIAVFIFLSAGAAAQQPGSLDLTFGTGGITTVAGLREYTEGVVLQSDGKIVAAGFNEFNGESHFLLARYRTDGIIDSTFGTNGKVITAGTAGGHAEGLTVQADGKIVACGYSNNTGGNQILAVARYNTDGSLDLSFSGDGIVTFPAIIGTLKSVKVQSDGKIVLAGYSVVSGNPQATLLRLNPDGSPDTSFDSDGFVYTMLGTQESMHYSVLIQNDGKIVTGGFSKGTGNYRFAIARYTTTGSLDNTFGTSGITVTNVGPGQGAIGRSLVMQSTGKFVVAGFYYDLSSTSRYALARYDTNGTIDASFGSGGTVITGYMNESGAYSVGVESDDRIVATGIITVGGGGEVFHVVRYRKDGAPDPVFGNQGLVTTVIGTQDHSFSLVVQPDNKIVVVGFDADGLGDYFSVVRYNGGCPPALHTITQATCGPYTLNGQTYAASGTYTQTLSAVNGCDSLLTLHLTVNESTSAVLNETACNNFLLNGQTYNQTGAYQQLLQNVAGCDSTITLNLLILPPTVSELNQQSCGSFTLNGQTYTQTGTYQQMLTAANGCDSILTLHLVINTIPNTVSQTNGVLTVTASNVSYQWYNCENNTLISGATSASFMPVTNGNYAVILTSDECVDTSECVFVTGVGLAENTGTAISVYPNPTTGMLNISLFPAHDKAVITISDITGQEIHRSSYDPSSEPEFRFWAAPGIYFVEVICGNDRTVVKVIVQ